MLRRSAQLRVAARARTSPALSAVSLPILLYCSSVAAVCSAYHCCFIPSPRLQVNAVQLPHLGQRILRVGDTVSFGGPANVRVAPAKARCCLAGRQPSDPRTGSTASAPALRVLLRNLHKTQLRQVASAHALFCLTRSFCAPPGPPVHSQVLRDGVSLQNPFRFVFEEYQAVEEAAEPAVEAPPAAVVQALVRLSCCLCKQPDRSTPSHTPAVFSSRESP